jgi:hypothetical protein
LLQSHESVSSGDMFYLLFYSYVLLVAAGWLAYRATEPAVLVIVVVAAFLTLPGFFRQRGRTLLGTTFLSAINALLFASLAYGLGPRRLGL